MNDDERDDEATGLGPMYDRGRALGTAMIDSTQTRRQRLVALTRAALAAIIAPAPGWLSSMGRLNYRAAVFGLHAAAGASKKPNVSGANACGSDCGGVQAYAQWGPIVVHLHAQPAPMDEAPAGGGGGPRVVVIPLSAFRTGGGTPPVGASGDDNLN